MSLKLKHHRDFLIVNFSTSLPVATLKDGSLFNNGARLTTTDALQIQNKYCKMKDTSFIFKEHLICDGKDAVGLDHPVFVDRYCDNFPDCPDGSDEDGSVIQCDLNITLTENGCCNTYVMNGEEFVYGGIYNGRDYFNSTNPNSDNIHLIPSFDFSTWYRSVTSIDQRIYYNGYAKSATSCPPTNVNWISANDIAIPPPICKSMGPIMTNYCAQSNCHADAECTNTLESFTCTCRYGYVGDGVDCEALPVEDECTTGNNLCDVIGGVCTDTAFSYTCSCDTGFWDVNPDDPGRQCDGCCETVDLIHQNSVYTSCTLNTDIISRGGDKWVYECDTDESHHLEYVSATKWPGSDYWAWLRWTADGPLIGDSTVEVGSDIVAEGRCFPPSLTFEKYFTAVCTSRVDDNMTTPASVTISTQASTTSTKAAIVSTEATTSTEKLTTAPTTAPTTALTTGSTTQTVNITAEAIAGPTSQAVYITAELTAVPTTQVIDTTAKAAAGLTTQASQTFATAIKKVIISGALATTVIWNDDLNDSSSEFYTSTSTFAKADLELLLTKSSDVQIASVDITGFERINARRGKRQTSSSKTIVNYKADVLVQEGKSTNEIEKSLISAVKNADPSEFHLFDSFDDINLNVYEKSQDSQETTTADSASQVSTRSPTEEPGGSTQASTEPPAEVSKPEILEVTSELVVPEVTTPELIPEVTTELGEIKTTQLVPDSTTTEAIADITTVKPIQEISTKLVSLENIIPEITTAISIPEVTKTEFVPELTMANQVSDITTADPIPDITTSEFVPYYTKGDVIPTIEVNTTDTSSETTTRILTTEVTTTISNTAVTTLEATTAYTATIPTIITATVEALYGVSTIGVITETTKFVLATESQIANVTEYQTDILASSTSDYDQPTTSEPTTNTNLLTVISNILIFSESELEILTKEIADRENAVSYQFEYLNEIKTNVEEIQKRLDIMRDVINATTTPTVRTTTSTSTTTVTHCHQTISTCGFWNSWSSISSCSATCGKGLKIWERCFAFIEDIDQKCETETRICSNKACPGWAKWSIWGPCSAKCRESGKTSPTQDRYRCWDTKTSIGVDCGSGEGDHDYYHSESRDCNFDEYCQFECEWQQWGEWSECNPDCDEGIKLRRRTNNEDQGASCDPNDPSVESQVCSDNPNQCETCYNLYDKCDRIPTSYCSDVRFESKVRLFITSDVHNS